MYLGLCMPFWCEMSGRGLSCQRFEYAYLLEKSIGPLTETMPNHGKSFNMDFLISFHKFNLLLSWYFKRSLFVCCPVVPVCIAFAKRCKSQNLLCTCGMEVPLCEHLVKKVYIQWKSMVILKLSSVWWKVLLTTGHETFYL
jgi:hypothetical protein